MRKLGHTLGLTVAALGLLAGPALAQNTVMYNSGTSGLTLNALVKAGSTAGQGVASSLLDDGTNISTTNENLLTGTGAAAYAVANDGVTGTTTGKLAKLNSSGKAIIAATTDTSGVLGVVLSGGGTSSNANITVYGPVSCTFDNTAVQGDYVIASISSGGECHDAGTGQPTVQVIGKALTAGAGSQTILALTGSSGGISSGHVNFTASGSWTPPTNYSFLYVEAIGGGGGGGGGGWQTASTVCQGGGGGAGGAIMRRLFSAAQVTAALSGGVITVTIGNGGTGGTAATVGAGNAGGNAGSATDTTFGTLLTAFHGGSGAGGGVVSGSSGGGAGGGGASVAGAGGNGVNETVGTAAGLQTFGSLSSPFISPDSSQSGANGPNGGSLANQGASNWWPSGGAGAGGGITSGNVLANGGSAGGSVANPVLTISGGTSGVTGGAGTAGANAPTDGTLYAGAAGSGGAAGSTTAGVGGAGGVPGGPGGGAGCLLSSGTTTAAGGSGARGEVRLWWN